MSDMKQAISRFRAERAQLEIDLRTSITALTSAFYEKTGVRVVGIEVGTVAVRAFGQPTDYVFGDVRIDAPMG